MTKANHVEDPVNVKPRADQEGRLKGIPIGPFVIGMVNLSPPVIQFYLLPASSWITTGIDLQWCLITPLETWLG